MSGPSTQHQTEENIGATSDEAATYAQALVRYRTGPLWDPEDPDEEDANIASKWRFFRVVEEIAQIQGLPEEIAKAAQRFLTVHSGKRGIDPNAASIDLLSAIFNLDWSEPSLQPANKDELRKVVLSRSEFVTPSGQRAFLVRAEARSDRSVFVREATVEFRFMPPGYPLVRTWKRGAILDASGEAQMSEATPPPC